MSADDDPLVDSNPVFTQQFMLVDRHRQRLAAEEGLELWHFEQHLGEVVFIPGGCPHQVRNLQSCCKVSNDDSRVYACIEAAGRSMSCCRPLCV